MSHPHLPEAAAHVLPLVDILRQSAAPGVSVMLPTPGEDVAPLPPDVVVDVPGLGAVALFARSHAPMLHELGLDLAARRYALVVWVYVAEQAPPSSQFLQALRGFVALVRVCPGVATRAARELHEGLIPAAYWAALQDTPRTGRVFLPDDGGLVAQRLYQRHP